MTRFRNTSTRANDMEAEIADLIDALRALGDDDLAGRLWRCQRGREEKRVAQRMGLATGWAPLCRSPACPSCRRWLGRSWRERAASRFAHADNEACSHVTIMLARTGELGAITDVVRDLRVALRNLRDRRAREARRWASVEAFGLVEVDALFGVDVPGLPPQRRAVIEALPSYSGGSGGSIAWVPHAHLSVHHPCLLDRGELREALIHQWPGPAERVDVRPFQPGDAGDNAANLFGYAAKATMRTTFSDGVEVAWPMSWRTAYWSWLCGLKNGLAPLRIKMGPMQMRDRAQVSCPVRVEVEPMPVLL